MVVLLCGKEERMAGPGLPCQRSPWLVRFHIVLLVPAARKVRVCLCPAPYHILMSHHSTAVQKNHTGTYVLTFISACRRGTCARVTDTDTRWPRCQLAGMVPQYIGPGVGFRFAQGHVKTKVAKSRHLENVYNPDGRRLWIPPS